MTTITSFFTSIVIFFTGLFGGVSDMKPAVVNPPVVIQESGVNNTSVDASSKNIEIISPIISSSGDQIIKPGIHEIKWKALNSENISVMLKSDTGEVLVNSGLIKASLESYNMTVPEVVATKGSQPKYFIVFTDNENKIVTKSNVFVIGCTNCANNLEESRLKNVDSSTGRSIYNDLTSNFFDVKTVKVGDFYGKMEVVFHEVAPNSTRVKFSGNMIATGILGINEMTGSLILSATKEGGLQIPKFKGDENSNGGFCLTGDIGKIIESIANIKNITVEVKNYSIYIAGKGGCSSSAELVRIIDQVSKSDSNLDSVINKIKNTTYSFMPIGKGSDGSSAIQVTMSEGKSIGSDGWSREIVSVAVDEKSGTAVVALNVSSGTSTHFPMLVSFADIANTPEQKDALLPTEYSSIKLVSFDTNGKVRVTTLVQGSEKVFVYDLNSVGKLSLSQ